MPIISKRKLIKFGGSKVVTIPDGHTLLESGDEVQALANGVVIYAPMSYDRKRIKEDLKKIAEDI